MISGVERRALVKIFGGGNLCLVGLAFVRPCVLEKERITEV